MKKLYFLKTNGYDMIVSYDGSATRFLTETNDFPIYPDNDTAMEFLKHVIDDSSWDVLNGRLDDIMDGCEILAELETEL